VQQPIWPEVVGDVDLGQPIPIEISGSQRQRPTVAGFMDAPRINFFRIEEVWIDLLELDERGFPAAAVLPQEEVRSTTVEGSGQRFCHWQSASPVGIEIGLSIRAVVADDQVAVAVAVEIGLGGCTGEPALPRLDQLAGDERLRRQPLAARRSGLLEINDRRTTPEIDEHIGQAILVEVTQQTARGSHRRAVGEGPGLQDKGLIAILGCSGRRSNDHLVDARIDVAEVVRQPISIDVAQRG
jgi:hypothetical protein